MILGTQSSAVNVKGTRLITFGQRLRAERERIGMNQSDFGESCGVGKNAQINYEGDKRSPDGEYLMAAAKAGADILFILTGERTEVSLPKNALEAILQVSKRHELKSQSVEDFVAVPMHAASLAAGDGNTNDNEEVLDHLAFRRSWLKRMGITPAGAVIARTKGESMWPTINDGDIVLIDRTQAEPPTKLRQPGDLRPSPIYALLDDGLARLKRIELAAPGMLALLSDNPSIPPDFRPASDVLIIGKVRWWGHTVRD